MTTPKDIKTKKDHTISEEKNIVTIKNKHNNTRTTYNISTDEHNQQHHNETRAATNKTATIRNRDLEEEVYMDIPLGFSLLATEGKIYKLKKSIYGLMQSPSAWFFHKAMVKF